MSLISDISAFSNPFGTPAKGKWAISSGFWIDSQTNKATVFFAETRAGDDKGVFTAIDQISDTGNRRLAVYEYPYLDGQKIKDLGRKGETYTFNIKFFGPDYQAKYKAFYKDVYMSGRVGKLGHPVLSAIRGAIDARLQSFEPIHRADESNAVTFKAVFVEDNTAAIDFVLDEPTVSTETALQASLQSLVATQANISNFLAASTAFLKLPAAIAAGIIARKNSLMSQVSGLLGQLGATFSSTSDLLSVLSVGSGALGGATGVSSGTVVTQTVNGGSQITQIPPAFQTGLDPNTQMLVQAQISNFVNANQVTPQQAVFNANQSRGALTAAITEIETNLGNDGYDIVVQYRALAVSVQSVVEACISSAQSKVKIYKVLKPMSLRAIAFANGLDPDRCLDIEALNPYLASVNYIPAGSTITVPAA